MAFEQAPRTPSVGAAGQMGPGLGVNLEAARLEALRIAATEELRAEWLTVRRAGSNLAFRDWLEFEVRDYLTKNPMPSPKDEPGLEKEGSGWPVKVILFLYGVATEGWQKPVAGEIVSFFIEYFENFPGEEPAGVPEDPHDAGEGQNDGGVPVSMLGEEGGQQGEEEDGGEEDGGGENGGGENGGGEDEDPGGHVDIGGKIPQEMPGVPTEPGG